MHSNGSNYSSMFNREEDNYVSKSEKDLDILQLFNVLYLKKWTIVGFVFLSILFSLLFYSFQTPLYKSKGTILISQNQNRYSYAGSDLSSLLTSTYGIGVGSTIANELQILSSLKQSYELASKIMEIEYDKKGRKFPILWKEFPSDSASAGIDTVAFRYRENIRFSRIDPLADVIEITFESFSPHEAATVVNLTMDTYSALSTEQNKTMASSALSFLSAEKNRIESQLISIEDSLRIYMNNTNLVSVDSQTEKLIDKISAIEKDRQEIKVKLVAINSALESYQNQLDQIKPELSEQFSKALAPTVERFQFMLAELETEKLQLKVKNPSLDSSSQEIKRIDREIDEVKDQIKNLTSQLLESNTNFNLSFAFNRDGSAIQKVSELTAKIIELSIEKSQFETQQSVLDEYYNELDQNFEDLPNEIIQLARLERDVNINEELYILVANQFAEMSLWEKTQFGMGRPLDYARPRPKPVYPDLKIVLLIGIFLGGLTGVGFVLIMNAIDDRINSTDDIKTFRKPLLGTIPDFSIIGELDPNERQYIGDKSVSNQLITLFDHISPISEAYRRLRINVVYANPDKDYKILMVSSATKGEGKSTVAANLAVTFTGSEKKVLIIDLDLRRPTQHKIFGENKEPGLSDALFDATKDVRLSTVAPNVDLITVGHKTPEPASVLDSKRLKQLIDKYKAEYDHIILDTAPYGIISDSASLLRLIDGLIVVSRFNVTTKRELKFTLEGLEHLNADVLGIVLNAFDPKKSTDYYTNYNYYKRTYSEYYKYR